MADTTIAFLGCGNMGGALARAAAQRTRNIILTSGSGATAAKLAETLGVRCGSNKEAAAEAGMIFLGVKPQIMPSLFDEIRDVLAAREDRFILVSMAAGLTVADIRRLAGREYPLIRIMPNTPAAVGQGMILYCGDGVTDEEMNGFLGLMEAAGQFDEIAEKYMDAAGTVAGCTPAWVCQFIESLADGGVACGLPRAKSLRYAAQAVLGTAALYLSGDEHPGTLKDAVCSPGGATIQGVRALEKGGFRSSVIEAVIAAYEKTLSLGK